MERTVSTSLGLSAQSHLMGIGLGSEKVGDLKGSCKNSHQNESSPRSRFIPGGTEARVKECRSKPRGSCCRR